MRVAVVVSLIFTVGALGAAGCSSLGDGADERAARHAAARLGVPASQLRVTAQTDLTSPFHTFNLVVAEDGRSLVVVQPRDGEPFDAEAEGAFERVARDEDAVKNLSRLGAERVALWFAVLGGERCPMPTSNAAKFTTVQRLSDGVRITYDAGKNGTIERTCLIELAADGSLREGRLVERPTAATSSRAWRS
jgi:hypothetical protein